MKFRNHLVEVLESRIAPAAAVATTLLPSTEFDASGQENYVKATFGAPVVLHAGQVLTTGGFNSGSYLLYVQKGEALVFLTDLNNNRQVDFNEITGISAGNGLQMISFVDIHGDIVTNLKETTVSFPGAPATTRLSLSDSDNNPSNDDPRTGGDGRVLLDNTIGKIELRALRPTDVGDLNGDGSVDESDALIHQAPTTCSIFGSIYAGGGFGTTDGKGGLIIDTTNAPNFGQPVLPFVSSIRTGTAVSGEFFSFGASNGNSSGLTQLFNDNGTPYEPNGIPVFEQDNANVSGIMLSFSPARGEAGGDIIGVSNITGSVSATGTTGTGTTGTGTTGTGTTGTGNIIATATLNIDTIHAGNGGAGGRGGNISNVIIPADDTAGYTVIAGDGGSGPAGGDGGSILHFSDLGSITGQVTLETGNGGGGVTGAGGNGGNFTFDTFNARGAVHLTLGSGGDGFIRGGNGASLLSGTFTQADAAGSQLALNIYGDTHVASGINYDSNLTIGTHAAINFNPNDIVAGAPDTFGDLVFTTGGSTSQLVVELGDPFGGYDKVDANGNIVKDANGRPIINEIDLPGPRNATALTVADVNGDGHPDIIVGSGDVGSQQGIEVFLSRYDTNGKFLGFSSPIVSVLPQLDTGDPQTANNVEVAFESPQQISSIVAGDFNGDGKIELAVAFSQYEIHTVSGNQVTDLTAKTQALMFLQPDVQNDYLHLDANHQPTQVLTGQFYADFGTKGFSSSQQTVGPAPKQPVTLLGIDSTEPGTVIIEASPIKTSDGHDVVFAGIVGEPLISTYVYTQRLGTPNNIPAPAVQGIYSLGSYDSNRQPAAGSNPNTSPTEFDLLDYSVDDYNHNGTADLVAINNNNILVGVKGTGNGAGTQDSGNGSDQSGNNFAGPPGGLGIVGGKLLRIKTLDTDNGAGIETIDNTTPPGFQFIHSVFASGPQIGGTGITTAFLDGFDLNTPAQTEAFDFHYVDVNDPNTYDPGATAPNGGTSILFAFGPNVNFGHLSLALTAGSGGNSLLGSGGLGGNIGSGKIVVAAGTPASTSLGLDSGIDPAVTGQLNLIVAGDQLLTAGDGGDGFTTGGLGGSITGVNLQHRGAVATPDVPLSLIATAGDGGRGVSGLGGQGGNIGYNAFDVPSQLTDFASGALTAGLQGGVATLLAGDGGAGAVGGAGGSIIGNGTNHFDVFTEVLRARAGHGGSGARSGGAGGGVTNFHATLPQTNPEVFLLGELINVGSLDLEAGYGGTGAAGKGGAGGSVLNSSPTALGTINSVVTLLAGDGGAGVIGGAGGLVSQLKITTASPSQPSQVTVHGGLGGNGTAGNGGTGGSILNVSIPSRGTVGLYNSVIAGDGGDSAGATGGFGGNVSNLNSSTTDNSFAVTAGAGGSGLYRGGNGGSVMNTVLNFGASTNKALVIAGAGGDAHAFIPNTLHGTTPAAREAIAAYGGRAGIGGLGGSITNFSQIGSNLSHADLIAGNGGSTLNFGTFFDRRTFVGNGGSISNIVVDGTIGNINPAVPIKSYNDVQDGQTVADFVTDELRTGAVPITDALGNVGIVVGASGSNEQVILEPDSKPLVASNVTSRLALNGSLVNVTANHLMSAVAGSVDFIAAIQVVRGLNVPIATLATDVDKGPVGQHNYIDSTGAPSTSPSIGGALVDGIIAAKVFVGGNGKPSFPEVQLG